MAYKHIADSIKESPDKRFTSDTEKTNWNNTVTEVNNFQLNTNVTETNATFQDTIYHIGEDIVDNTSIVLDSIEGNTMVNLITTNMKNFENTTTSAKNITVVSLKSNTTYTFVAHIKKAPTTKMYPTRLHFRRPTDNHEKQISAPYKVYSDNEIIKFVFTTPDSNYIQKHTWVLWSNTMPVGEVMSYHYAYILEGDYTNKPIPEEYFEGIKSSFEDKLDINNNKYEVNAKAANYPKNLFIIDKFYNLVSDVHPAYSPSALYGKNGDRLAIDGQPSNYPKDHCIIEEIQQGKTYTIYTEEKNIQIVAYDTTTKITSKGKQTLTITTQGDTRLSFGHYDGTNFIDTAIETKIYIFEGSNNYIPHKSNNIKLYIDEPLRAINDNIKDKLCVINNKLMVERIVVQGILNGSESWTGWKSSIENHSFRLQNQNHLSYHQTSESNKWIISDRIITTDFHSMYNNTNKHNISISSGDPNSYADKSSIFIRNIDFETTQIADFKNWLSTNNINYIARLKEPIYEEVLNEYGVPILLEGYDNSTIYIDTNIPPKNTKISYSIDLPTTVDNINNLELPAIKDRLNKLHTLTANSNKEYKNVIGGTQLCEDTMNGYIDNINIKGNSLVNVSNNEVGYSVYSPTTIYQPIMNVSDNPVLKSNTQYTIFAFGINTKFDNQFLIQRASPKIILRNNKGVFTTNSSLDYTQTFRVHFYGSGFVEEDKNNIRTVIIEGDHTDKDINFFEGLQGIDVNLKAINNNDSTQVDYKDINLPIEYGLKSLPNNVKDEIYKEGNDYKLIQRVGYKLLNGNETYQIYSHSGLDTLLSITMDQVLDLKTVSGTTDTNKTVVCNILPTLSQKDSNNIGEGISARQENKPGFWIRLLKTKVNTQDNTGVKKYFQDNNALVFYELETPIVHTLNQDINIRTFNGSTTISIDSLVKPQDKDFSFETHSNLSSVLNTAINKVNKLEDKIYNNNQASLTLSLNSLNNEFTLSNIINEGQ